MCVLLGIGGDGGEERKTEGGNLMGGKKEKDEDYIFHLPLSFLFLFLFLYFLYSSSFYSSVNWKGIRKEKGKTDGRYLFLF